VSVTSGHLQGSAHQSQYERCVVMTCWRDHARCVHAVPALTAPRLRLHYLVCQKPPEYLRWRVLWPCSAILIQEKYRRPWWILTS
jgi:hypothetical protein